jgi:hypothetical protein
MLYLCQSLCPFFHLSASASFAADELSKNENENMNIMIASPIPPFAVIALVFYQCWASASHHTLPHAQ